MKSETLLKKFKKIVKNKKYFELEDVDKLNCNYNILFFLGKKNIGKTYQLLKLLKSLKPGEKIIYGRYSDSELKALKQEWNNTPSIPFKIKGNDLYDKEEKDEKGKELHRGKLVKFKNLQNTASMQFEGYKLIIFDEIIPYNASEMKESEVNTFFLFLSNVERNKDNLKIYLFGNNNGANPLMSKLKISLTDDLIYKEDIKLLFINSKSLYKGIEGQKITSNLLKYAQNMLDALLDNRPLSISDRQITDLDVIDAFEPMLVVVDNYEVFCIKKKIVTYAGYDVELYLLKYDAYFNSVTAINDYQTNLIVTFDEYTSNKYDNVIFIDNSTAIGIYNDMMNLIKAKRLYFENEGHIMRFINAMKKNI